MLVGTAIGVWGIWATVKLVKGMPASYKMSLQVLVAGVVIGFIHIYASRALRGKSMPVDAVVYMTVLTLIVFLLFRIPGIWQGVNFDKGGSNRTAGGAAAIVLGIFTLTIQFTMGSTHTWGGVNYADAFNTGMTVVGILLVLGGAGFIMGVEKLKITATSPQVHGRSVL